MSKNTQIGELINYISVDGSGNIVFTTVSAATTNTDKFLVSDSGVLKFRTAAQLLSDIGAQASGSYQAALSGTGFVKISGSTISYDNSTYATETYVGTAISNLVASSPATLDTLNELALALGSDPNFATTVATSIGTKQAQLNGTGFVKISGTTISYDNSTYALDSAVVKLAGIQTITGVKTFTGAGNTFTQNTNFLDRIYLRSASTTDYTNLSGHTNQLLVGVIGATHILSFPENTNYTYTFPAASGTLAFTSNLSSYLPLTGGTLTGQLNISYSGSPDTLVVTSSGSANGIGLKNRTGDDYAFFNWRNNSGTELLAEQYLQRTAANTAIMRYTIANGSASPTTYLTIAATGDATFSSKLGVGVTPYSQLSLPSGNGWNGGLSWNYTTNGADSRRWWINTDHIVYGDFRICTEQTRGGGTINNAGSLYERFYIDANGRTGIGTTSLNASGLTIYQAGSDQRVLLELNRPNNSGLQTSLQFTVGNSIMVGQIQHEYAASNQNHMSFSLRSPGGSNFVSMWLKNDGNVGIGNNNPTNRLHVSGNIYSTDTVFGRNLKPEAFAGPAAGSPTGASIPLGYSTINISSLCDNSWRTIMSQIGDSKIFMWVSLGDAASKNTGYYTWQMTSPAYGVANFTNIHYLSGGWNTGGFEFTYDASGGNYRLLVRTTSYYSAGNTAYGTIYFLRLE